MRVFITKCNTLCGEEIMSSDYCETLRSEYMHYVAKISLSENITHTRSEYMHYS